MPYACRGVKCNRGARKEDATGSMSRRAAIPSRAIDTADPGKVFAKFWSHKKSKRNFRKHSHSLLVSPLGIEPRTL